MVKTVLLFFTSQETDSMCTPSSCSFLLDCQVCLSWPCHKRWTSQRMPGKSSCLEKGKDKSSWLNSPAKMHQQQVIFPTSKLQRSRFSYPGVPAGIDCAVSLVHNIFTQYLSLAAGFFQTEELRLGRLVLPPHVLRLWSRPGLCPPRRGRSAGLPRRGGGGQGRSPGRRRTADGEALGALRKGQTEALVTW